MDKTEKLSPPEKVYIEELLKSAMHDYAVRHTKVIKDKEETAQKLSGIISEYLGPFMLIGYDSKGEPFNIIHAQSQLDVDAITAAINKLIFNINSNE
jgi:hypothetical protein